ncbi:hypothetical protein ABPG77_002322 [Micractinium sp. CCAP 211/92]
MLQHLAGILRAAANTRPELLLQAAPALSRQARCFGFGAHMSDNDPEVIEKEKQRHLKGQSISHIKQVPGWSEKLASDAEAVVKAEHDCTDCSVEEMQSQTIQTLKVGGGGGSCCSTSIWLPVQGSSPAGCASDACSSEEEEADSPSHQGITQEPRSGAMGA